MTAYFRLVWLPQDLPNLNAEELAFELDAHERLQLAFEYFDEYDPNCDERREHQIVSVDEIRVMFDRHAPAKYTP